MMIFRGLNIHQCHKVEHHSKLCPGTISVQQFDGIRRNSTEFDGFVGFRFDMDREVFEVFVRC